MALVLRTVRELRETLAPLRGDGIGMVPTMGALHDGHLSLVTAARAHCPHVVVSIFVNPTQFAPHEDFDAYPRNLEGDIAMLDSAGETIVFAPNAREMYPQGFGTAITVTGPSAGLESDFRPHFFGGVATVVAKLLIAALPDIAVFGEKDYQQLMVVTQAAQDLNLPTRIMGAPTLREADGLAMSSRNVYLDPRERQIAGNMNKVLKDAILRVKETGDVAMAEAFAAAGLAAVGFDRVDYTAIRDARSLARITDLSHPARILAAAWIGRTRLIDNMPM